jgi:aspartate kinase
MIVMKFGGSSFKDSKTISNIFEIIKTRIHKKPVIVCSAIPGITDMLFMLGTESVFGNKVKVKLILDSIIEKHLRIIDALFKESEVKINLIQKINEYSEEIKKISRGISLISEMSDKSSAKLLSYGELFTAIIITSLLQQDYVQSEFLDAREFIKTGDRLNYGENEIEQIKSKTKSILEPVNKTGKVGVTQGFSEISTIGCTTVYSNDGSDYSAAITGMVTEAEEIEIWTDVDGVLTADPDIVSNPHSIKELSFEEASELAYFGAKVIQPSLIIPAREKNITVRILNSFKPEKTGTMISNKKILNQSPVKSITFKKEIVVLNICSTVELTAGEFFRRIFESFDKNDIAFDLINISETNISVTLNKNTDLKELTEEFKLFSAVKIERNKSQISVIGINIKNTNGIESKILNELREINISLISHGASKMNFSFVIERKDLEPSIRKLHRYFFED